MSECTSPAKTELGYTPGKRDGDRPSEDKCVESDVARSVEQRETRGDEAVPEREVEDEKAREVAHPLAVR